jgi:general nucleoside transport system ATP-binding protein
VSANGAAGDASLAIELVGISKSFGAVQANRDIHLAVRRGTIHGIVGENGAGKSTLMSILYGFYHADSGEIRVNGRPIRIPDSQAAIAAGIGMVHQHFMLVEPFTVLENVVLGAEEGPMLRPSLAKARTELRRLEQEYELEVDPDAVVGELSVGLQQRVEILKALYRECDILILDEPTGVLTPAEADHLFRILRHLKAEGKTIILITHKLREIMAVTDDVSVMRRGEMVRTLETSATSPAELAEAMVGRRVLLRVEKAPATPGRTVLEVEKLDLVDDKGVHRLKQVSLAVRAGEILGIAGVAGNGQSELLEVIAGIRAASGGAVRLDGRPLEIGRTTSADARRADSIAHIPEDRHRRGLVMAFAEWENSCLGYQREERFEGPAFTLDCGAIRDLARTSIERFDIRPPSCDLKTANFSGGNQQKIVIAREMERDPEVLLVGQPTRGVDIGAIEFIHQQIVALRDRGKAILLVSVELDEIQALSDRIIVMFDGRISGERAAGDTDERELGLLMAGIDPAARGAA